MLVSAPASEQSGALLLVVPYKPTLSLSRILSILEVVLLCLCHFTPSSSSSSAVQRRQSVGHGQGSTFTFASSLPPIQDLQSLLQVLGRSNVNPVTPLTTPQVIQKYGYPVESYDVETADGYILTMHRIPWSKRGGGGGRGGGRGGGHHHRGHRPVVYLQHGLFASSFEWFMNEEEKLLPLRLSDAGYDVWLGNARGNAYSRRHKRLTPANRVFWEFSVNEMGKYDLPAEIDYVLNATGQRALTYIGFSMGTTMFWVMLSHHPEYNSRVKLMTALAPVVYLNNMEGLPRFLAPLPGSERFLKVLMDLLMNGEFLPPWMLRIYNSYGAKFCSLTYIAETICTNLVFLFAGYDLPQTQIRQLPLFFSHTPSPTSTRTLSHLGQFINSGKFAEYNFGHTQNLMRYGSRVPPDYKLQNTKVPVALIYGPNDAVVHPIDVKKLSGLLPNIVLDMPVNFTFWNHFDYHLGRDSNELVNNHVLELVARFQ